MPYSTPSTPMGSPSRETPHSKKGFHTPPTHVEDVASPSGISGPMPGIPRRASSRPTSPAMSRTGSSSSNTTQQPFSVGRPGDGLPRRSSHTPTPSTSTITGVPQHVGTLGLKLHPSPTRPSSRGPQDSLDSTSTIESSLPSTPRDESSIELPAHSDDKTDNAPIPFPPFQVTPRPLSAHHPLRSNMSPPRPGGMIRQHSGPIGHHSHSRGQGSLQLTIPGSASTSTLMPSPVSTPSPRPSAMIRKKSGEVVKPSLKQRSMSTPDLTRLPEESPDFADTGRTFGQERSKSVRFAPKEPVDGSKLDNVKEFDLNQRPAAVSRNEEDGPFTETETENDNDYDVDTDASEIVEFSTGRYASARGSDGPVEIALEGGSRIPRVRCDFSPDARHALDGEMVVMERAELKTVNGALCLQGTAIVRNVAFQKWVAVRFTMDRWSTVSEVSGNHVCHIPSSTTWDEGWDRFSFSIKLEDFRRKLDERQLMICIRFSVDGQEWWDSNNGLNYQFNFKRITQRKVRKSLPPGFHARAAADFGNAPSIPGLRQNSRGNFAPDLPSSKIAQQLGGARPRTPGPHPRDWTFPTNAPASYMNAVASGAGSASGADSPMLSPPPTAAFRPPGPPDVHAHLTLSAGTYCAPSPPQSPPKLSSPALASTSTTRSPQDMTAAQRQTSAEIIGEPSALAGPAHERRSSWAGKVGSWDSFSKVMADVEDAPTDGSTTPLASESRSNLTEQEASSPDSPPHRALTMKRSTGDLQALRAGGAGLLTPPSSQDTSPSPLKRTVPLPDDGGIPMSPSSSSSLLTTGESSPVNTVGSDSEPDIAGLRVQIDPPAVYSSSNNNQLSEASYAEFINRFCFFTSPRTTPMPEDLPPARTNYVHVSGRSSPTGFPFYGSGAAQMASNNSHSGNVGPSGTPRREYDSAQDAFNLGNNSGRRTPTTPRASARYPPSGPSGPGGQSANSNTWAAGPSVTAV